MSKKGRFARRGVRNKTGIGAEELDQVLKEKRPEDEEIDKKLEDGLKNKDINEPFNQEAVQEVYKPTRTFPLRTRANRKASTEEPISTSPYGQIKTNRYNNSELLNTRAFLRARQKSEPQPVQPTYQQPAVESASSEEEDDDDIPDMNEINIRTSLSSVDPRDERIYELEDKIEELQLELDQKDIIIKQKDAEIRKLLRSVNGPSSTSSYTTSTGRSRRAHNYQPRQSDF